jgi:hypothetical protein
MKAWLILVILVAAAVVSTWSTRISAQDLKLGALKNLHAWGDRRSPGHTSIHLTGTITASNPCNNAVAKFAGMDKGSQEIYRVHVELQPSGPRICAAMIADIPFVYRQSSYAGRAKRMRVFSDDDSQTVPIQIGRANRIKTIGIHLR